MRKKRPASQPNKKIAPKKPVERNTPQAEYLDELSPEARIEQLVAQSASFSGPIPHPEIFRQYANVIPDAPERILKVFEDDSKHVRDIAVKALQAQIEDNRRAHWMAWSLVVIAFISSLLLAWKDKDILAGTLIGTTLTAIVIGFLKSRNHEKA